MYVGVLVLGCEYWYSGVLVRTNAGLLLWLLLQRNILWRFAGNVGFLNVKKNGRIDRHVCVGPTCCQHVGRHVGDTTKNGVGGGTDNVAPTCCVRICRQHVGGKLAYQDLTLARLQRQYAITPLCQYASMPVRQYASTSVRQYANTPLRHYAITLVHQYASTPVRQYAITPLHHYASTSVRQYASTPVCQ